MADWLLTKVIDEQERTPAKRPYRSQATSAPMPEVLLQTRVGVVKHNCIA